MDFRSTDLMFGIVDQRAGLKNETRSMKDKAKVPKQGSELRHHEKRVAAMPDL